MCAALPGDLHHNILFQDDDNLIQTLQMLKEDSVDESRIVGILPNEEVLSGLFRVSKSWAKVSVENISSREGGQEVSVDMKIQGFSNVLAASDGDERFVVCQKPDLQVGIAAALPPSKAAISGKSAPTSAPAPKKSTTVWAVNTDDLAEDDLVDEDDLLNDGLDIPIMACEPNGERKADGGKRRACKNCSCGLAELEADEVSSNKVSAIKEFKSVQSSGCGNCSKGDAFRCGGCPFLGKPTFEKGQEKVVLAMGDDI